MKLLIGIVIGLVAAIAAFVLISASISPDRSSPLLLALGLVVLIFVGGGISAWVNFRMIRRMAATRTTQPGWYDDPASPDQLRYWDGYRWTDHTGPRADGP